MDSGVGDKKADDNVSYIHDWKTKTKADLCG